MSDQNNRNNDIGSRIQQSVAEALMSGDFSKLNVEITSSVKEVLNDVGDQINIAVQMAGCHHEWWDGSKKGYPDHKHGDNIPLCARIMAVADVFDALTSKRCYKDAMPLEKAYSIISEESGTHFDSVVVDAFFAATPQIEAAYEHFCEVGIHNCIMEALDEEHHHM